MSINMSSTEARTRGNALIAYADHLDAVNSPVCKALDAGIDCFRARSVAEMAYMKITALTPGCDTYQTYKVLGTFMAHCHYWANEGLKIVADVPAIRAKVIRLYDGRLSLLKVVTTRKSIDPDSEFWYYLQLSGVTAKYIADCGHPVESVLYDVVRMPSPTPHEATPVDKQKRRADGYLFANQREADETPEDYGFRCYQNIAEEPSRYMARMEVCVLPGVAV